MCRALGREEFARFLLKLSALLHMNAADLAETLLQVVEEGGSLPTPDDSATASSMDSRDAVEQASAQWVLPLCSANSGPRTAVSRIVCKLLSCSIAGESSRLQFLCTLFTPLFVPYAKNSSKPHTDGTLDLSSQPAFHLGEINS